jgi:predicted methyltransferase
MMTISNARAMLGLSLIVGIAFAGCATQAPLSADQLSAVLSAPDRSSADKDNDTRRKARDMLAFIDARPGMRILDVGAGGG